MKILHCADIHLDSAMSSNLDKDKAKERKRELLATFKGMVSYAADRGINNIIIAGDLFDTRSISVGARREVHNIILNNSDITFYYLQGNHDDGCFASYLEEIPSNLKMFGKEWTHYTVNTSGGSDAAGNVVITGAELDESNAGSIYDSLSLNVSDYNVVVLHGQEADHISKNNAQVISLKELKNKSIDYLALGHVHTYSEGALDARGTYCYPGCLEGRGFDEAGEHGFVVLDIDEETGKGTTEFVPFARRNVYVAQVDVTGCESTFDMERRVSDHILEAGYSRESMVEIKLVGALDVECEKDTAYIGKQFENDFFVFKVKDLTTFQVDYMAYEHDASLKGEFIRNVMASGELSPQDKSAVIRYGLQALRGEEID